MDDDERCGPYHSDCDCVYECRDCHGRVVEDGEISETGHKRIDYWCNICFVVWSRAEVRRAGNWIRRVEREKLAEWTAWAQQ